MLDIKRLFSMQEKLDRRISEEHGLHNEDLMEKKLLALFVELGELANETRCFKFWSKKSAAPQHTILEEYVDGIHFILSIGLELKADDSLDIDLQIKEKTIVQQFNFLFNVISAFQKSPSLINYQQVFKEYLSLGELLGFTVDQIEEAYMEKNKVNHARQDQGY